WTVGPNSRSDDAMGDIRVWEIDSGKELLRFQGGPWPRAAVVAYSPDGKQLVTAGERGTLKLRDAITGKVLLEFTGQDDNFWLVVFSPDGTWLASHSGEEALLWDLSAAGPKSVRAPARVLRGIDRVTSIAFTVDSQLISVFGVDGLLKTWKVPVA